MVLPQWLEEIYIYLVLDLVVGCEVVVIIKIQFISFVTFVLRSIKTLFICERVLVPINYKKNTTYFTRLYDIVFFCRNQLFDRIILVPKVKPEFYYGEHIL